MSLLHRQVVSRMRQRQTLPQKSTLARIGQELSFSSPPLRPSVGSIFFVSREEIQTRATPVQTNIDGLTKDIRANFYYQDPDELRKTADSMDQLAKDFPSLASFYTSQANDLRGQADILEKRKTRPNAEKEKTFSISFFEFSSRWDQFRAACVDESCGDEKSGLEVMNLIDNYYDQTHGYIENYKLLSGKSASIDLPKSHSGDVGEGIPNPVNSLSNAIPWTPIIIAGVVLGGTFLFLNRPRFVEAKST
jgi:hypothetical protein